MKRLVLFTRLTNEDEWNAWNLLTNHADSSPLKTTMDNIELHIYKGSELGAISSRSGGNQFLANLWEKIAQYKDESETLLAIHFGDGGMLKDILLPWLNNLESHESAKNILYHFRLPPQYEGQGRPVLREYSADGASSKWVETQLSNLSDFYLELHPDGDVKLERTLNLLHRCLTPEQRKNIEYDKATGVCSFSIEGKIHAVKLEGQSKKKYEGLCDVKTDDPFNQVYIYSLSDLRDELLKDY